MALYSQGNAHHLLRLLKPIMQSIPEPNNHTAPGTGMADGAVTAKPPNPLAVKLT